MKLLVYSNTAQHLSDELKQFIIDNFDGIDVDCYIPEAIEFASNFDYDKSHFNVIAKNWQERIDSNPQFKRFYFDEPINERFEGQSENKWNTCDVPGLIEYTRPNITIGEMTDEAFNLLYGYDCKVAYTAYSRLLFTLFGFRIRWPFPFFYRWATPIKHWEDLESKFGDRFSMVWVHAFDNVKYAKELKQWAKDHNKELWIYAGVNTWQDEKVLIEYLTKWR